MLYILKSAFRQAYLTVANFLYWGWALRGNRDWDYGYLDRITLLKLRRMHRRMAGPQSLHDPSCQNYAPKMRSLKLALKLAERLEKNAYQDNLKYPLDYRSVKIEEGEHKGDFRIEHINPATGKPATALYRKLAADEFLRNERRQGRDRVLLYHIIAKYGTHWWD